MKSGNPLINQRTLFSWIASSNLKLQFLMVLLITIAVFARVIPLEMQKKIINDAIFSRNIDLLLKYCGIYLAAVVTANLLKFLTNTIQTYIAQKTLADMRKQLYHHILTLPLSFFRKTHPGVVVSSLVTEIASSGDFVGKAIAVPVTNILTLLAFGVYLFMLNPLLALVSLSIYPVIIFLIPWLQGRVNKANKRRVDTTRKLSDKISESVTGIHEIHGNGAYVIENRKYDRLADRLKKIRITWNLYKYAVKSTNNFFNSLTPFLVFILGGYLTIRGQLELGALVAFLSAQEKLYDPWKEMLDFYQSYQDSSTQYKRVMEYFDAMPEHLLAPQSDRPLHTLEGGIDVEHLSFYTDNDIRLLDDVSFSLKPGEHMALVGFSGSGKSTLAHCISQLYRYTGGHIFIGNKEVGELTKADIINNMGIISQTPFIFDGTIENNLLYACAPLFDENSEKGGRPLPTLDDMIAALQQSGIFVDVLRFGLNMHLAREQHGDLVERIIRVRKDFQDQFGESLSDYVEFFNEDQYLHHSTVAENIIFGTVVDNAFSEKMLPSNPFFTSFLHHADLTRPLLALGAELTRETVDILGSLPAEAVFFEQSPLQPDELEDCKILNERLKKQRLHEISDADRQKLLEVALRFSPGRHKMAVLPQVLETLILEGRAYFRDLVTAEMPDAFVFHDAVRYIDSQTILNNILFGKLITGNPQAVETINQRIIQLLIQEDLLETVLQIGMQFQVGAKGDKLSGGQRQKLAIARVFLKKPRILIMDEATSALDNNSQARIQNLLENRWKGKSTVISVVHRLDIIKNYDLVAVMKAGKIGEIGTYDELLKKEGLLYELIYGKK